MGLKLLHVICTIVYFHAIKGIRLNKMKTFTVKINKTFSKRLRTNYRKINISKYFAIVVEMVQMIHYT